MIIVIIISFDNTAVLSIYTETCHQLKTFEQVALL